MRRWTLHFLTMQVLPFALMMFLIFAFIEQVVLTWRTGEVKIAWTLMAMSWIGAVAFVTLGIRQRDLCKVLQRGVAAPVAALGLYQCLISPSFAPVVTIAVVFSFHVVLFLSVGRWAYRSRGRCRKTERQLSLVFGVAISLALVHQFYLFLTQGVENAALVYWFVLVGYYVYYGLVLYLKRERERLLAVIHWIAAVIATCSLCMVSFA